MLKSKLKGLPEGDRGRIIEMVDKNPELFMKIATETKEKIDAGKSKQEASMEIMAKYSDEFKKIYKN